jgi:hypothetical protein
MLGRNAQGEWRAATVKLRLVNKQYAVTEDLFADWLWEGLSSSVMAATSA